MVQSGNTCASIVAHDLSIVDFISYNPTVNRACSNLISNDNICVGSSGPTYTPATIAGVTATKTDEYATATVQPSGTTASGTTRQCGKYHQVIAGDICQQISLVYTISVSLFMAINPSIDKDCYNLIPTLYYCVFPMQNWNATANATTTSIYVIPPAPTSTGTTPNCYEWYVLNLRHM